MRKPPTFFEGGGLRFEVGDIYIAEDYWWEFTDIPHYPFWAYEIDSFYTDNERVRIYGLKNDFTKHNKMPYTIDIEDFYQAVYRGLLMKMPKRDKLKLKLRR